MEPTTALVELRELVARYADLVTRRAWDELVLIFTPDCVLELDLGDRSMRHDGPEAIGAFIGTAVDRFEFFTFAVLNLVLDVDVDAGVAVGRLHMQELRMQDGRRTDAYGIYHDQFVHHDGRWWFRWRRYGSFSRTAEPADPADQLLFPRPHHDLAGLLADARTLAG